MGDVTLLRITLDVIWLYCWKEKKGGEWGVLKRKRSTWLHGKTLGPKMPMIPRHPNTWIHGIIIITFKTTLDQTWVNGLVQHGWCLCPVANFSGHVVMRTRVHILMCPTELAIGHEPFPFNITVLIYFTLHKMQPVLSSSFYSISKATHDRAISTANNPTITCIPTGNKNIQSGVRHQK